MITFKKKSLHYKFNNLIKGLDFCANATNCKSLCSYFWSTVWNLFSCLIAGSLILIFFTFVGMSTFKLLGSNPEPMDFTYLWIVGLLSVLLVLAGLLAVLYIVIETPSFVVSKLKSQSVDKEPSVVLEWVKAKKDKVCPMIKFED